MASNPGAPAQSSLSATSCPAERNWKILKAFRFSGRLGLESMLCLPVLLIVAMDLGGATGARLSVLVAGEAL